MKHFNIKISFVFFLAFCFFSQFYNLHAQVKVSNPKQLINDKDWNFVENIGQLAAPDTLKDNAIDLHSDIKYYSHNSGPDIYCRPGMISFVFSKIINNADGTDADLFQQPLPQQNKLDLRRHWEDEITNKKIKTISSRADLVLLNANLNAQVTGVDEQAYYENYYTSYTPESGVNHARTYKTIVYNSIYPHIDMLIHAKPGGVEYEFAIFPGGNASNIKLKWNGLKSMELMQNGGLHYINKMIDMQETKPVSSLSSGDEVPSNFTKSHHIISFSVADYDHSQTLIIDPTITWGTYLGGGSRNWGEAVWTDDSGSVLMCGPSTSPTSNIATPGAFLTSSPSSTAAFLSKFSSGGSLLWCTYYGGSGYNDGWGLSSDNLNDVFMGGATSSTSGIATSGSAQSVYGGGTYGGYIVKFRSNGSRIWASYYGSTKDDQVLFIATDAAANVFLTSWTSSTTGVTTSGAYQAANGGGYDAGLAKYDSTGKQVWSTCFGGSGFEEGNVVATDLNGNSIICGQTASGGLASPGAYQTSNGGGTYDGFVASFSPSGGLNWSTYIGGSGLDIAWGVVADQFGNVYVNGQTASKTAIGSNIPYQPSLAGTNNTFLSKFSPKGQMIWSTYYGGVGSDIGNNLGVDPTGSILIAGNTSSKSGIATSGGYQSSLVGTQDAFFGKFSPAGNLMYGSYYGAGSSDVAVDIHADAIGNTYISGYTSSISGIATSGGYQSSYSSGGDNAFLASFFINTYANDAGIAIMPPVMCAGKQPAKVMLENFGTNKLTSVTINWSLNGKLQSSVNWSGKLPKDSITAVSLGTITFTVGKIDTFKVWTSSPNGVLDSMPQNDTMYTKVSTQAYPIPNAGGSKKLCAGSSTFIGSGTGSGVSYSWTSNPSGFVSNSGQPKITPKVTTTYYLTETTFLAGCSASDSATITVGQIPTPNAGKSDTICYGGSQFMGGAPVKGHTYAWSSTPVGFTSSLSKTLVSPTVTTIYYETEEDTSANCVAYSNATITVSPEAKGNAGGNQKICPHGSATIGISSVSGHSYSWTSSPAGFTSTKSNPTVSPDTITTYYLADVLNATGCTAGDSAKVSFNPLPVANSGGNQTICSGSSVQLGNTAVNGDTYSWKSKPAGFTSTLSNPTVNPSATTDYFITETITATECSKTDTAIVTTNPLPSPKAGGNQVICIGSSVILGSTATAGHSYLWSSKPAGFSSNSAFPTVSPIVTTTYYLTEIIAATSCYKKDSAVVKVNSETANAGPDRAICLGQSDTLGVKSVNGNTYSWTSNPSGFNSFASNPVVKPTVSTIYYLEATGNATGCNGFDTVIITVNPLPLADAGHNLTACAGTSVSIGDTTSAIDSFSWTSSPSGFSSDLANPQVNPITTTIYRLTETNPITGCSKTNSVVVLVSPLPNAKWFITYAGDVAYIHAVDSSLSDGSYLWNLGDGNTATGHIAKHLYHGNKAYSIRLTVTGSNGCTNGLDSTANILYSGIDQKQQDEFGLHVFPNPFQASTSIEYKLNTNGKIKILLFDVTGKQIGIVTDENQVPGSYHLDINAEKYHLSPGMYLLQFMNQASGVRHQASVKIVRY